MQWVNMTAKSFRDMVRKENKFHAQKTVVDNITFDSKHESRDYIRYKQMEKTGIIQDLQRQVKFELQPAFVNNKGENVRAITYLADFTFIRDGVKYAVDSKSEITKKDKTYRIKRKMFEYKFPDYIFVES